MNNLQAVSDRFAIGLSLLCAVHCLAVPVLLVMLPSLAALQLDNEAFHAWMVVAVLPTSIYALTLGCKNHKRYRVIALGFTGLALLLFAVVFGEEILGGTGEKLMTVAGTGLVAWGHLLNFKLCKKHEDCHCDDHEMDSSL